MATGDNLLVRHFTSSQLFNQVIASVSNSSTSSVQLVPIANHLSKVNSPLCALKATTDEQNDAHENSDTEILKQEEQEEQEEHQEQNLKEVNSTLSFSKSSLSEESMSLTKPIPPIKPKRTSRMKAINYDKNDLQSSLSACSLLQSNTEQLNCLIANDKISHLGADTCSLASDYVCPSPVNAEGIEYGHSLCSSLYSELNAYASASSSSDCDSLAGQCKPTANLSNTLVPSPFSSNEFKNKMIQSSKNSTNQCTCQCHCKSSKLKNIKTGKLLSSLAKLTINGLKAVGPVLPLHSSSPPLSSNHISTRSLSSLDSNSLSVSGASSVNDNQYTLCKKPNRPPPPPPQTNQLKFRPAAFLPKSNYENLLPTEESENIVQQEKDRVDNESLYALVQEDLGTDDDNYETVNDNLNEQKCSTYDEEEEDLYQDVLVCEDDDDEDIYETLPSEFNYFMENSLKNIENEYTNRDSIVQEMDLKLMRKQKALEKKRQIQMEKMRKRFNVTGNEIPINTGMVKADVRGNQFELNVNKGEIVLIIRIDGNPPGKWLAKNERSKLGYVDLNLIDVDLETVKSLMNVPNLLTNTND